MFEFRLDPAAHFGRGKWRNLIVKPAEFFDVNQRNDIGADRENLRELDETRAKRCNARGELPRALAVGLFGRETGRSCDDPSPPVAQKCNEKRRKTIPDDEDSQEHGRRSKVSAL